MENNEKKIPDKISEIMNGLKSSIPDLKGLGNISGLSNKTINMLNEIKTPPYNIEAFNKATNEAFEKKRKKNLWRNRVVHIIWQRN